MSKIFNWHQVLNGEMNRMRYIERYAGLPHLHSENVAEHSYYVALYAFFLSMEVAEDGVEVQVDDVVIRAILHDMEESMTGDLLRSVKHGHKGLHDAMHDAGQKLLESMLDRQMAPQCKRASTLKQHLMEFWREAKGDDIEGAIVSLADFLGVVSYASIEQHLGSKHAYGIQKEITQGLKEWIQKHRAQRGEPGYRRLITIAGDIIVTMCMEVEQ